MSAVDFSKFVSPTPHPGEHLREEFLPAYRLTPGALAKAMGKIAPASSGSCASNSPSPPTPRSGSPRFLALQRNSGSIFKQIMICRRRRFWRAMSWPGSSRWRRREGATVRFFGG